MRAVWVVVAVLLVCCPLALAQETEAQRQEEILKELRSLRESVDELSLRVQALEQKMGGAAPAAPTAAVPLPPGLPPEAAAAFAGAFQRRGADVAALSKITLPDNPTKEQAREYVTKIQAASQNQNSFSSDDPQVAMLERVGPDNLDVLVDAYGRRGMGSFYLENAITHLARPEHKDLILRTLPAIPELAQVVVTYGWQEEAKDTLISGLQTTSDYLPREWMQATASLKSPEAVEALKQYMIRGQSRQEAFGALRVMPNAGDLAPTVATAWEAARFGDPWQRTEMAKIAVPYGHVDALGYVIEQLGSPDGSSYERGNLRSLVLRYTPARGSDQAILEWYNENRDDLVWDAEANVYKVKEAAKASP
jgi:hypothetical protein